MKKTLTFHTDPAHGWLEVDLADLQTLNISDQISHYSYTKGNKVYLEEDCDAPHYLRAATTHGWNIEPINRHTNYDSFIRALPRWRA